MIEQNHSHARLTTCQRATVAGLVSLSSMLAMQNPRPMPDKVAQGDIVRRCPKCNFFLCRMSPHVLKPEDGTATIEVQTQCPNPKCKRKDTFFVKIQETGA